MTDAQVAAKHRNMTRLPAEPLRLDRLIRAGAIHSMTGETYRSVGLRGAEIVAVSEEPGELDDLAGRGTVVVDAGDLTVLPAFAEAHEHLMEASRNTLPGCRAWLMDRDVDGLARVEPGREPAADRRRTGRGRAGSPGPGPPWLPPGHRQHRRADRSRNRARHPGPARREDRPAPRRPPRRPAGGRGGARSAPGRVPREMAR